MQRKFVALKDDSTLQSLLSEQGLLALAQGGTYVIRNDKKKDNKFKARLIFTLVMAQYS